MNSAKFSNVFYQFFRINLNIYVYILHKIYILILTIEFDSYIKSVDTLNLGEPRLLEVDNRCVVPCDTNIRFCITSADVIHA